VEEMKLGIATTNRDKLAEAKEILALLGYEIEELAPIEVKETETTFIGNAVLKARANALFHKRYCLADDSGISIKALNGLPGVYSARFAHLTVNWSSFEVTGEQPDKEFSDINQINNQLLLDKLGSQTNRKGNYTCAIALASPTGELLATSEGHCPLELLFEPIGHGGFGYDPICTPLEPAFYGRSFAELMPEEKNVISHRRKALDELAIWLERNPLG
jgi:XTP/dITP diphosphohydrolase